MERPSEALDPDEMDRWDRAARRTDELGERAEEDADDADPVAYRDPRGTIPDRMREKLRRTDPSGLGERIEPDDFFR